MVAGDLWLFDLDDDRPPIRLTFDESSDAIGSPLWTPDGTGIVYEGDGSLYRCPPTAGARRGRSDRRVTSMPTRGLPTAT